MSEDRAEYLASGSGEKPADHERLDLIRAILGKQATWSEPPPEVGDAVLTAIATGAGPVPTHTTKNRRWWPWAAAAAAGAAVIAVVLGLTGVIGDQPSETVVAIEGTELEAGATGEATLGPAESGWWIRLNVDGLQPAPAGTYYEGWVWSDQGDGVSIGTFHLRGEKGPVTLWSGVDPADYPSIWVTLEDEDGDASASDRVVMRGRILSDD